MASRTPAGFLGREAISASIAAGMRADLVALDPELKVLSTWIGGASDAEATSPFRECGIRAHASSQAGRANEEHRRRCRRFAWIVDGASGVGAANLTSADTDASWLARTIDAILRERIEAGGDVGLDAFIRRSRKRARAALRRGGPRFAGQRAEAVGLSRSRLHPTGSTTVRHAIRRAVIGDVCVFAPVRKELFRWTDERLKPFEAKTLPSLSRNPRETRGCRAPCSRRSAGTAIGSIVKAATTRSHPYLPWADRMLAFEAHDRQPSGRSCSQRDGFLRLSDLFESMDDECGSTRRSRWGRQAPSISAAASTASCRIRSGGGICGSRRMTMRPSSPSRPRSKGCICPNRGGATPRASCEEVGRFREDSDAQS